MLDEGPRGEMDITALFGSAIVGSNPAEGTKSFEIREELKRRVAVKMSCGINELTKICGYSLVAERDLAMVETGFRLPLPAHRAAQLWVCLHDPEIFFT